MDHIEIIKPRKEKMVYFRSITLQDVVDCFKWNNKHYLGIAYNIFPEGSERYDILEELLDYIDWWVKPWWCPRWFLNILHLFGNNNTIWGVRIWWIHRLHNWIVGGNLIIDIKTKFDSMRIYGYFDTSLRYRVEAIEHLLTEKIQEDYENYTECY